MTGLPRVPDAAAAPESETEVTRERALRDVEREASALGAQLLRNDRRSEPVEPVQTREPAGAPRKLGRRTPARKR